MVSFSRRSLHYRIHSYAYGEPHRISICPYFWKTLLAATFFPLIYGWKKMSHDRRITVAVSVGLGIMALTVALITLMLYEIGGIIAVIVGWGGLAGILTLIWGVGKAVERFYHPKPKPPKPAKVPKEKKPSLLAEFLKAKKNKICPIIGWVD